MEIYAKVKITDLMLKAYESCGEDSRCDECPAELGEDDCIFNQEILTLDGWIPVSERLPKEGKNILVCHRNKGIYIARYYNDQYIGDRWNEYITCAQLLYIVAWQPLPEPYKGENEYV